MSSRPLATRDEATPPPDVLVPTLAGFATRVVRWRNALLARPGTPEDFDWTPAAYPRGFRRDRRPAPEPFAGIVRAFRFAPGTGEWARACALASRVNGRLRYTGPVQADLATTYRALLAGDGYCADAVRVFLALAHAAGVHARQWSFAFDGYGGHGHTLVEVWDSDRGAWRLLDVYNNVEFRDASSGAPMDALAFRAAIGGERPPEFRPVGAGPVGMPHRHVALAYYRRGAEQWYLHWGNAVVAADRHLLVRAARRLSATLAHFVGIAAGVVPRIRLLRTGGNDDAIAQLMRLRAALLALAAASSAGVVGVVALFLGRP